MLQLVRKPPVGNEKIDRFKVTFDDRHTVRQKLAMFTLMKFWLHQNGIENAGPMDLWIPLLDQNGYHLTKFPDGTLIGDYSLVIKSPYHCAADEYDLRPVRPSGFTPS